MCVLSHSLPADELTVLTPESAGGPPNQMLARYLKQQVQDALQRRQAAYEAVKTPAEAASYQERLRKAFLEHLGGFPERTPLNARVVGVVKGDRYRIEKVIYESQPHHFVTANLFMPTAGDPPYPVVVVPCGHSANGKVAYQTAGAFLALNGIACLIYDPIGQGERYQFLAEGKPRFGATVEHTLLGAGSIPLGRNTATYRIWDGMRSIDYVAGRKDLDPKKIGVTGSSGGGTLSSYLMALDERVACAAPSCYLTSFRRLLETIGPQDAEQNIHGQLGFGMDHADYLLLRAPKPTLILAGTQDFFDIQGTWDTFRQAKRFYTRLGFPERVGIVETDTRHGYVKPQREAMVRWMRRWLAGKDEPITEPDIPPRPDRDLLCTPHGQVQLLEGARSVVDLNVELNARLEPRRRELWEGKDRAAALAEVRRLAGVRPLVELPRVKAIPAGTVERKGYRIEKLALQTEPGIRLPALLFRPEKASGRRHLYLHGEGKQVDAGPGGPIEKLVLAGHLVLAVDLRGIGEIGPAPGGMWGGNWSDFFTSYLLGRSVLGLRTEDILSCARFLAEWENKEAPGRVELVAIGVVGPPALHAAALEEALFDTVKLSRSLPSWSDLVSHPSAPGQLINTVHGALVAYDLPDLARTLPRGKLTVDEPLDLGALSAKGK
jgi:cephalosporin-C deacetylase-like acetyl esterase